MPATCWQRLQLALATVPLDARGAPDWPALEPHRLSELLQLADGAVLDSLHHLRGLSGCLREGSCSASEAAQRITCWVDQALAAWAIAQAIRPFLNDFNPP